MNANEPGVGDGLYRDRILLAALVSDQELLDLGGILNYDLAPDGKRFGIFPELQAPVEEKGDVHVTFLLNFFDELRRRAPAEK